MMGIIINLLKAHQWMIRVPGCLKMIEQLLSIMIQIRSLVFDKATGEIMGDIDHQLPVVLTIITMEQDLVNKGLVQLKERFYVALNHMINECTMFPCHVDGFLIFGRNGLQVLQVKIRHGQNIGGTFINMAHLMDGGFSLGVIGLIHTDRIHPHIGDRSEVGFLRHHVAQSIKVIHIKRRDRGCITEFCIYRHFL
ncbi:hypothetical protein BCR42DRAFT_427240 [Absidia repens]|uniref:Uncharacterized protein n=1 Tax=Absidia repens TaxID=90262 RepID=A0A1X2I062_9FUNG|nr:hypothetical protein BCR42DRAFT_427240 [Absidia repens]